MADHDVVIVGAGISGIGAAYNLKKSCPSKSFTIFEGCLLYTSDAADE